MRWSSVLLATAILLLIPVLSMDSTGQEEQPEEPIVLTSPASNETIGESLSVITGEWNVEGEVEVGSVVIMVNGFDVTGWEEATEVNENNFTYEVVEYFELQDGNHTVHIYFRDMDGIEYDYEWTFFVDTTAPPPKAFSIYLRDILIALGILLLVVATSFSVFLVYLKVTRNFSIRKFFRRHPPNKNIFIVYAPLLISILLVVLGLMYIGENDIGYAFTIELLLIFGLFLGGTAFALEARRERKRMEQYEQAFAQLLFELADAMRGGSNPAKAIVELAEIDTGVFQRHLRIAAKNIKTGRPFEDVLKALAKPTRSEVVRRYTTLIGEASKVGGQLSIVIHRAAKDMDDLIKVKQERQRQLVMQMVTIYIAFSVLVVISYLLIDIYPELANVDLSMIMNFNLQASSSTATAIRRMTYITIKRRFFHLVLINSIGSGLVIGKLLHGKMKYGLLHSLIMVGIATLIFVGAILGK